MDAKGVESDAPDFVKALRNIPPFCNIPAADSSSPANNWFGNVVSLESIHFKERCSEEQIRLIALFEHAANCSEDECSDVGQACEDAKKLLLHMEKCNISHACRCKVPHCSAVRQMRDHFRKCKAHDCSVCPRARLLLRELKKRKRPRLDTENAWEETKQIKRILKAKPQKKKFVRCS